MANASLKPLQGAQEVLEKRFGDRPDFEYVSVKDGFIPYRPKSVVATSILSQKPLLSSEKDEAPGIYNTPLRVLEKHAENIKKEKDVSIARGIRHPAEYESSGDVEEVLMKEHHLYPMCRSRFQAMKVILMSFPMPCDSTAKLDESELRALCFENDRDYHVRRLLEKYLS